MGRRLLIATLVLSACSSSASPEQERLMDTIETRVRLPPGARPLTAYARYYALDGTGRVLAIYTTFVAWHLAGNDLPVGRRRWLADYRHLPNNIIGDGCNMVSVVFTSSTGTFEQPACNASGPGWTAQPDPPPPLRGSPAAVEEGSGQTGPRIDRQAPGTANQVPYLEGTSGRLRYRPGCLLLDAGGGDEIGLVIPADVSFDGKRMIGKVTTPEGEQIVRQIGQSVSLSGAVIENPQDGRYSCDTKLVLIADYF